MKTNITKRFIAIMLVMTLLSGLVPGMVLAAEGGLSSDDVKRVEGKNGILLGENEPKFVIFSDGQIKDVDVAIWLPVVQAVPARLVSLTIFTSR